MIVIGVDPGTLRTGWGVVVSQGTRLRGVDAGVIDASGCGDLPQRLDVIYEGLCQAIDRHEPRAMAIEDIFHARYARSALQLGHARGVAMLAAVRRELEVHAFPPALVKRSIAGRGQAHKQQVAKMVGALLGLRELPPVDATDALAVAITHLNACRAKRVK